MSMTERWSSLMALTSSWVSFLTLVCFLQVAALLPRAMQSRMLSSAVPSLRWLGSMHLGWSQLCKIILPSGMGPFS